MPDLDQDAVFADAQPGEGEVSQADTSTQGQGSAESTAEQDQLAVDEGDFLRGTSFKDGKALATGYKNIQRLVASKDKQIRELSAKFNELLRYVQQFEQSRGGQQGDKEQPDNFWNQFTADPKATVSQLIAEHVKNTLKSNVMPLRRDLVALKNKSEIRDFLREHPDFTDEDEDAMIEIMRQRPWLHGSPNRLEEAYEILEARKLKESRTREQNVNAVKDAKTSAGLGGKKSTLAAGKQTDEFDEVLAEDKAFREMFRLGRS